jgi:hypothetical protein
MKCEEAAEFVSALCDGEGISRDAAEHVAACEACGARLKDYLEMGAELRRVASLELLAVARTRTWEREQRVTWSWWTKGWETMRIPRLAFALLLVAAAVLGSGLAVMKVGAHTQGPVLMLTARPAAGNPVRCALSTVDKNADFCAQLDPGQHIYAFRVISVDGDRMELGVRVQFTSAVSTPSIQTSSLQDVYNIPERRYWFEVGETLEIDVPGSGQMTVTGELMDHMPSLISANSELDPKQGELRVVSPVLIRDQRVVFDFEGFSGTVTEKDKGVSIYTPSEGRWLLSLSPLKGAVQGHNRISRISFEMNRKPYAFLMAAPVARNETIWVLHEPEYRPSWEWLGARDDESFAGSVFLGDLLVKARPKD